MVTVPGIRTFLYHKRQEQELLLGGLEQWMPDAPRVDRESTNSTVAAVAVFVDRQHLRGVLSAATTGGTQLLVQSDSETVRFKMEGLRGHGRGLCSLKTAQRGVAPLPQPPHLSTNDTAPQLTGAQNMHPHKNEWRLQLRTNDLKRAARAGNTGAKAASRGMESRTRVSSTSCCRCLVPYFPSSSPRPWEPIVFELTSQ